MLTISLPQKSKIAKFEGNRAVFEIEGLYPGYGITLGNALRRVILSSLPGAAVTGVKIKGVQHEFSTLPFVAEDVIEILLNLKQVRFRLFTDGPVKLFLNAKGVKEVKAGDIQTTAEAEVINKEAPIVTMTDKKAELEMEIEVEKGLGFVPVEQRKKQKLEVGLIAVDAIFTPIRRVNFEVENMRVGDRTDYSRLILDIETDGSIGPTEALEQASKILVEQFRVLAPEEKVQEPPEEQELAAVQPGQEAVKSLGELKLPIRIVNILTKAGFKTTQDLIAKTEQELQQIEGMGDKGIAEIKKVLKKSGLNLKE